MKIQDYVLKTLQEIENDPVAPLRKQFEKDFHPNHQLQPKTSTIIKIHSNDIEIEKITNTVIEVIKNNSSTQTASFIPDNIIKKAAIAAAKECTNCNKYIEESSLQRTAAEKAKDVLKRLETKSELEIRQIIEILYKKSKELKLLEEPLTTEESQFQIEEAFKAIKNFQAKNKPFVMKTLQELKTLPLYKRSQMQETG